MFMFHGQQIYMYDEFPQTSRAHTICRASAHMHIGNVCWKSSFFCSPSYLFVCCLLPKYTVFSPIESAHNFAYLQTVFPPRFSSPVLKMEVETMAKLVCLEHLLVFGRFLFFVSVEIYAEGGKSSHGFMRFRCGTQSCRVHKGCKRNGGNVWKIYP